MTTTSSSSSIRNKRSDPMENQAEGFPTQIIDEYGTFNRVDLNKFIQNVKLAECGFSYAVVTIIGPQSSGKSTLLNNLFHTNFKEMNYMESVSQTTKGIWIARCADIEPCTVVMDVEGSDGKERGQDDTAFEHQSALFALAASNVVLFNLWCHGIGREHGGCKPLLKTTFQVMLESLIIQRKTTFVVIIRDKTKTPFEILERGVREDIQKIWDSILKPEAHKNALLSDYLNLQVVALSSYERDEEEFKKEVASLRQKLFQPIAVGDLAVDRQTSVPASGFSFSIQEMWKDIKTKKELNLPSHRVLVATKRCDEIADERYSSFLVNKDWLELEKAVNSKSIPRNGQMLSSLLNSSLSSYDKEATGYEQSVRHVKRKGLEEKLLRLVQPTYNLMLEHIRSSTLNDFKIALNDAWNGGQGFAIVARDYSHKYTTLFDEKCKDVVIEQANSDLTKIKGNFSRDLDSHLAEVKIAKLSELASRYETTLKERICEPVESFLIKGSDDTWRRIRNLVSVETRKVISEFEHSGFEMDEQANNMKSNLINYAKRLVEEKTRQEVKIVLTRMNERFASLFNHDKYLKPRVWAVNADIEAITETAHFSCLKLLSVLAAIRLDEDETDTIWDTLVLALDDPKILMASKTWENVPATKTLITPIQCKKLWDKFVRDNDYYIIQANDTRKTNRQKKLINKGVICVAAGLGVGTCAFVLGGVVVAGHAAGMAAAGHAVGFAVAGHAAGHAAGIAVAGHAAGHAAGIACAGHAAGIVGVGHAAAAGHAAGIATHVAGHAAGHAAGHVAGIACAGHAAGTVGVGHAAAAGHAAGIATHVAVGTTAGATHATGTAAAGHAAGIAAAGATRVAVGAICTICKVALVYAPTVNTLVGVLDKVVDKYRCPRCFSKQSRQRI